MRIFFVVVCIAVFTTSLPAQSEVTRKGNYIYIKTRLDQLVDRNITDVLPEVIGLFVDRIKDIKAEERYEVESSERTREILENVDPFLDIVNERIFEHRGEQDEEHAFRLSWSSILPTGFILFGGAGAKGGTTIKGRGAISAGIFVIPKRVTQINIYTKEKRVSWEFAWSIIGWPQISAGVGTDVGASVGNRWGLGLVWANINNPEELAGLAIAGNFTVSYKKKGRRPKNEKGLSAFLRKKGLNFKGGQVITSPQRIRFIIGSVITDYGVKLNPGLSINGGITGLIFWREETLLDLVGVGDLVHGVPNTINGNLKEPGEYLNTVLKELEASGVIETEESEALEQQIEEVLEGDLQKENTAEEKADEER